LGEDGINISGGQQQLIAFARALYRSPSLLLLDEPTSAMDTKTEQFVINLLQERANQFAILLVTHREHLAKISNRVYLLGQGRAIVRTISDTQQYSKLSEIVGQDHLTNTNSELCQMVESGRLQSTILWGQAGIGKTTILKILIEGKHFVYVDARYKTGEELSQLINLTDAPIIAIDELQRIDEKVAKNLTEAIEQGKILIATTTFNPESLAERYPFVSSCKTFELHPPKREDFYTIAQRIAPQQVDTAILDEIIDTIEGVSIRRFIKVLNFYIKVKHSNRGISL
jgi:replication-associated recombination protein RarA